MVQRQLHGAHTIAVLRAATRVRPSCRCGDLHRPCKPHSKPRIMPLIASRATHQKAFQSTFIAEEPKNRKKARLSWYHPDDTVRLELVPTPTLFLAAVRRRYPDIAQTCSALTKSIHALAKQHFQLVMRCLPRIGPQPSSGAEAAVTVSDFAMFA